MARSSIGWRSGLALACAIAAGFSGSVSVDRYSSPGDYVLPVLFAVIGLALARCAIRVKLPEDRLLGLSVFCVLALFCAYMIFDRLAVWAGWRAI